MPAKTRKLTGPPPAAGDVFEYIAPNGKKITLPPMGDALNAAELRRLRNESQLGIVYYVLERDNDEAAMAEVDAALESMSLADDVPAMVAEWQDFSRTTLGESSAS